MNPKVNSIRVVVSNDGPYVVTGNVPLSRQTIGTDADGNSQSWRAGKVSPPQANSQLCRCGHSRNKPLCDGTHTEIRFDGTETASREPSLPPAKIYDGPEMQLSDIEELCAFARFGDPCGQVWTQVAHTDDPKCGRCSSARSATARQAD